VLDNESGEEEDEDEDEGLPTYTPKKINRLFACYTTINSSSSF
jgi:hypothetical protein